MSEIELILTKLKIVSEEKENGMYLCDKEHSKILLDYIQQKENIIKKAIEYVKTKNYCSDIFTKDFAIFDKQELLEILKGDNKE